MNHPLKNPLQYAGCYSLDLYCDQRSHDHAHGRILGEFTGETFADCAREAKRQGWKIHRKTRTATCPICLKREASK